jgi:hypothetical protein
MSLRKRFLLSAGLIVLGTAAAVFVTELVFALIFPQDPVHLTPAGNEAATQALFEGLVRFGLL